MIVRQRLHPGEEGDGMKHINIPIAISDFSEMRRNGYYYVDKTGLITEILKAESVKVTLITRPRRFGKDPQCGDP